MRLMVVISMEDDEVEEFDEEDDWDEDEANQI